MSKVRKRHGCLKAFVALVLLVAVFIGGTAVYAETIRGQSTGSMLIEMLFSVILSGKNSRTDADSYALLEDARKDNADYSVPLAYGWLYGIKTERYEDYVSSYVAYIEPDNDSGRCVYYLHGGAYCYEPLVFHWAFLKKIADEFDCRVVAPIYPKAPDYTYEAAVDMVADCYSDLLLDYLPEEIVFMGDSAGGGLAISLAMYCREINLPQPSDIICFSPWVDLVMDNPELPAYEKTDTNLALRDLQIKALAYAGSEEALHNYLVSPIFGDFTGLAPVTLFSGTREMFYPEVERFAGLMTAAGAEVNYYPYKNMQHAFVLYPVREQKQALTQIKAVLVK